MKNATASRSSYVLAIETVCALIVILVAFAVLCHGQTPPAPPAAPEATTVTVSGGVAQAANIAEAVAPNIFTGPVVHTIESIIIIVALFSRILIKYCPGLQDPAPGSGAAKVVAVLNHTGGVITVLILSFVLALPLGLAGCTAAQVNAATPTALQLAPGAGAGLASIIVHQWPTKAPAIIQDVEVFNSVFLLNGAPVTPANLAAFEATEAARLGLGSAELSILDSALQTGVIALQGYISADVKKAIGVNIQAVVAAFNAGMEKVVPLPPATSATVRVTVGPAAMLSPARPAARLQLVTDFGRGYFI